MKPIPSRPLEDIRAELDRIDERIFALVVERAALANEVRKAKTDTGVAALRPAREAGMLRALADRPRGSMELEQIWRLWRELIMANSRLQFPFTVDTVAASQDLALWDLGRSHFCFETPMIAHDSAVLALKSARSERTRVALLPASDHAWWPDLADSPGDMRIFAALPMIAGNGESPPHAFAVGDVSLARTGFDITVVHLVADSGGGHEAARNRLESSGHRIVYWLARDNGVLAGIDGFVPGADEAPVAFPEGAPLVGATVLGTHAVPLHPAEPSRTEDGR